MAYGMTNSGGLAAYKANQALTIAQEAKTTADEAKEAAQARGVPVDTESAVSFSFGCDASGVYIVTPDEEEEES